MARGERTRRGRREGEGRLTCDRDIDLHLDQRLGILLLHRNASEYGGATWELRTQVHNFAVVNGVRNDVVEGVGHKKPSNGSAELLGDVVLLRERGAEFHQSDTHQSGLHRFVDELDNGSFANFASDVRFGAERAQSSGLLLGEAGSWEVEGIGRAHKESD